MIASSKVSQSAQERWDKIVERFRAACILHKQGRLTKSRAIIKEELPALIKAWIKILPASLREDAKADLRDMFEREQALVDQGWKLQRIFKETLIKSIIPQVEAKIAAKYRAIYLSGYDRRRQQREEGSRASWVRPSYAEDLPSEAASTAARRPLPAKRVRLSDVSEMIDSLQQSEAERMADSVVGLESLVQRMADQGIEPILAAD